jgi:hypothetical protein
MPATNATIASMNPMAFAMHSFDIVVKPRSSNRSTLKNGVSFFLPES